MRKILVTVAVLGLTVLGLTSSASAATVPPGCRADTTTMATTNYWGDPGPTYRLTRINCAGPRPKSCLKLEIIRPVVAVLYEPSCSPTVSTR
jgi:hypothetical protein